MELKQGQPGCVGSPPDSNGDLVEFINDSARHVSTVTITFLVACVYIAVAVASTTHLELLAGSEMGFGLPLFDVNVPLINFYLLTPLLLFLLHLNLLLQEYFLIRKLLPLPQPADDGLARRFFPALLVVRMAGPGFPRVVKQLLRSTRWAINALLPLAVFLWLQVRFVPYHELRITRWHQLFVALDLILILYFRQVISRERHRYLDPDARPWVGFWITVSVLALPVGLFSLGVATPGAGLRDFWPLRWPHQNLSLRQRSLADRPGLNLSQRDLRHADFTGSRLAGADLQGADLTGALLLGADLRNARLEPVGGDDVRFKLRPGPEKRQLVAQARSRIAESEPKEGLYLQTNLAGADLRGAHLERANLILARLAGAKLGGAHLQGAELTGADLQDALLQGADLRGSDLAHAKLQRADLRRADLRATNLSSADLGAALLTNAQLTAADLSNAGLDGVTLASADLRAADVRTSRATGADLRAAWLWGASLPPLHGVTLRKARVTTLCREDRAALPYLVDFREVEILGAALPAREWDPKVLLDGVPEGSLRKEALTRIADRTPRTECPEGQMRLSGASLPHRGLLYDDQQRDKALTGWPALENQSYERGVTWGEESYHRERAELLMQASCSNSALADVLVRTATEGLAPAEPAFEKIVFQMLQDALERLEREEADRRQRKLGVAFPCQNLLDLPSASKEQLRKKAFSDPLRGEAVAGESWPRR